MSMWIRRRVGIDRRVAGEPRGTEDGGRRRRLGREYRPERWLLSIRQQLALRKLRSRDASPAEAAGRLGLPVAAVQAFYRFLGRKDASALVDAQFWFGEVPVAAGTTIPCPNRECSAPQTWYLPDPETGQSLPCRACRLREYLRQEDR